MRPFDLGPEIQGIPIPGRPEQRRMAREFKESILRALDPDYKLKRKAFELLMSQVDYSSIEIRMAEFYGGFPSEDVGGGE